MNAKQLSHELRNDVTPDLTRRRWIVGLSLIGTAAASIVSLYQTGVIHDLPDPPLPIFDSAKVDASTYGYKRLQTPDGLMMLATYAATAWLAGAGGTQRAQETPWLPVALSLKTLLDVATNIAFATEEWDENQALCFYCQTATVCSLVSAGLALPEAVRALPALFGKRSTAKSSLRRIRGWAGA